MSVTVDVAAATKMVSDIEDIVAGRVRDVMRAGARLLVSEIDRAFASKADPNTGRAWPQRRHDAPWPMLQHTGTLKAALTAGWGVQTKSGNPRIHGKVREGYYLGGYTRGRGHKPIALVAGAVQYGRNRARSRKGSRRRGVSASTGVVPPRPFFGFGRSAQRQFADEFKQAIRKRAG